MQFWVQVFAGNWSAFPAGYSPIPGELPLSMFVGVLLNLTALLGIINILWRQIITQTKERVMILAEAFRTRDRTIKNRLVQEILNALPRDQRPDIRKIVDDAFERGNEFWMRQHVVDLVGPDGSRQLESLMQKELQL